MLTLTLAHSLFLTKEERYSLHAGKTLNIIGICVPVWFYKGTTSEPAQEVFCRYEVTNAPPDKLIAKTHEGFVINLPQKTEPSDAFKSLPIKILDALGVTANNPTSEKLLDIKDGGSELLEFQQYNTMRKNKKSVKIIHYVDVRPIEKLLETIA